MLVRAPTGNVFQCYRNRSNRFPWEHPKTKERMEIVGVDPKEFPFLNNETRVVAIVNGERRIYIKGFLFQGEQKDEPSHKRFPTRK